MPVKFAPTSPAPGSTASLLTRLSGRQNPADALPGDKQLAIREKFQDFVGGTFYKEMLKSLRAAQKPSKYLNGGQAEKIFQGQMDQQIAEDLARQYAGHLSDPLFESYARQSLSSSSSVTEAGHALDVVA